MALEDFSALRLTTLKEVSDVLAAVSEAEARALAEAELAARRVFVTAAGRSGLALRGYAMRLMHLGLNVHVIGEVTAPAVERGDLLLAASGSGRTPGVLRTAAAARELGVRVAAITAGRGTPLASLCEPVILLPSGDTASSQPLGSLFEQCLWLFSDIHVAYLKNRLGVSEREMYDRHANLE